MANIAPDGTVGTFSFNHYSFGCVLDWLVRFVGGVAPLAPGYAEFRVAPRPVGDLRFVRTSYKCARGAIRVGWERDDAGTLCVEVAAPEGTTAHVQLPGWDAERVLGTGLHILFG